MKTPVTFTSATSSPDFTDVQDIDANELAQVSTKVHIVDVRRPEEYTGELGHIAGSRLVVLDTLPNQLGALPKEEPIVFVCLAGGRSGRATAYALANGFKHVYNMKGGMLRWNELGLPIER